MTRNRLTLLVVGAVLALLVVSVIVLGAIEVAPPGGVVEKPIPNDRFVR